jgi:ABC-2 type transport system ATP-binding protein
VTLRVSDVAFNYGSVAALDDVTFNLDAGVTALLGVNGAGKSTLLSVCAGILSPGAGTVHVSSRSLYARSERRAALASVAIMPQQVSFPANLTALDVVTYSGWLKGLPGAESARRARDCLASVGLAARTDDRCGRLSGGMTRRVALAQALVSRPDVVLLDEPSTGLDPEQRRGMVELIRGLTSTVLLSSHVVEDVEDLADQVIIIDGGRIVFRGDMTELTSGLDVTGRRSPVEAGFFRAIGREAHS